MGLICRPQTALPSRTVVRATGEATRLVPGRGFTVAGQCRIPTGLRCTPSHPSSRARARVLYHWASTGATNGVVGIAVAYRSRPPLAQIVSYGFNSDSEWSSSSGSNPRSPGRPT